MRVCGKLFLLGVVCLILSMGAVPRGSTVMAATAPEVWVDDDYTDSTPGWGTTCFNKVQDGIDAAGATVWVADGTYNENLDFKGKAITVQSINGPENCIIDCDGSGRGLCFDNNEGEDSLVSGLTITDGFAKGSGNNRGGGIYCSGSSPTIINCIISGNQATYGGGIYCTNSSSPAIVNCIVSKNKSKNHGGGIYCTGSSLPTIINSTIALNEANSDHTGTGNGGGVYCASKPTITNCILWGNIGGNSSALNQIKGSPTVTFSCVQEGSTSDGNINDDPQFTDSGGSDYHLLPNSPCIDTGNNSADRLPITDFEGDPRIHDGDNTGNAVVDMGADEFVLIAPCDSDGDFQECFVENDNVYLKASGLAGGTSYDVYIVKYDSTNHISNGYALLANSLGLQISSLPDVGPTNSEGMLVHEELCKAQHLGVGHFQIVLDVNGNGIVNLGTDLIYALPIDQDHSFNVTPELPAIALFSLGLLGLVGLVISRRVRGRAQD